MAHASPTSSTRGAPDLDPNCIFNLNTGPMHNGIIDYSRLHKELMELLFCPPSVEVHGPLWLPACVGPGQSTVSACRPLRTSVRVAVLNTCHP